MPPRKPAPPTPPVVVHKKRPRTSTATTLPASTAPKPLQPQRARQLPPPQSITPAPQPPTPTTTTQTSPEQQNHQQPLHHQWRQDREECLAVLRARWPQAFPTDIRLVKPHALGIHREILQVFPEMTRRLLHATLRFYKRWGKGAYWRAIAKGGPRYILDGTPNGAVTEQEQEHARRELRVMGEREHAQRVGRSAQASVPTAPTA
jgi:RNA chaperone ProQ/FINO-like protein